MKNFFLFLPQMIQITPWIISHLVNIDLKTREGLRERERLNYHLKVPKRRRTRCMFTGKETGGGDCMSDSSVDLSNWQTQLMCAGVGGCVCVFT